ncbi:MAG TPA: D-aminoacylase [Dongiaceae bacterium]|nr:D-aminoacylase [Dongiaceae bacterium]
MRADLIIRHAQVIDGSGRPRFPADLAVKGDRIAAVGDLGGTEAEHSIDGSGCILAPGFIDAHTHDDRALIDEPEHRCKTSQGVTTVVTGNCGFSLAPLRPRGSLPKEYRLLGEVADYRYDSLEDYLAVLDRAPAAVNAAPLVGHATLRAGVMAELDRPATDHEIWAMRQRLADSLAAGAFGFSTGLEYAPAKAAPTAEIIGVADALAGTGAVYATHTRDYTHRLEEAMEEAFEIGRAAKARVILSHHQGDGLANYGHAPRTLARYDRARESQPAGMDVYPYNAASTIIDYGFVRDAERVLIAWSEPHPEAGGRDLPDIAAEWGVDIKEACRRLSPGAAIYFCQDEGDVRRILAHPHSMIGSDGIPGGRSTHPRLWGSFPRVLGHYARDLGLLTLEEAVRKMTSLPAEQFGLADRGRIAPGLAADLVLFDPTTVKDRASFEAPTNPSEGIRATIVNGTVVCRDGMPTGALSGRALRRPAQA